MFVMLAIKNHSTCCEWKLDLNLEKLQDIMSKIVSEVSFCLLQSNYGIKFLEISLYLLKEQFLTLKNTTNKS